MTFQEFKDKMFDLALAKRFCDSEISFIQ